MTSRGTHAADRYLLRGIGATILISGILTGLTVTPVSAAPPEMETEDVVDVVNAAAPAGAQPVRASQAGESVSAEAEGTDVTVPVDGRGGIEVSAAVGKKDLTATVSLPTGMAFEEGVLSSDGTVVFPESSAGSAGAGAVAVQTLEDGATRIQTVIADRASEHEFGYGVDGYRATVDAKGNAGFVSEGKDGVYVPVERAWATDALGEPVATHYEVRGDRLYQVVTPGPDTAYPVVADPTWQWRSAAWGMTLNRKETASIKDYAVAAGMCAAFAKKAPVVACGVWASYVLTQAVTANKRKGCLHFVAAPVPGAILHVKC